MKMKFFGKLMILIAACGLVGSTWAFDHGKIAYTGAEDISQSDDVDMILKFASNGTFTVPANMTASVDYLVVGGGGGGGGAYYQWHLIGSDDTYYANGGNGGKVITGTMAIPAGLYMAIVGEGGLAGANSGENGDNGVASQLIGTSIGTLTAAGGEGGLGGSSTKYASANSTKAGSPVTGTASTITGVSFTYGTGGAKAGGTSTSASGGDNTGNGGQGGSVASSRAYAGGAGGSGIVVVRIKSLMSLVSRRIEAYTGCSQELSNFDGTVVSVRSDDPSKAMVSRDGSTVMVTGVEPGTTTVTVSTATTIYTYAVTVKNNRELVQTIDLAKGPDSATSHTETFDQTPTMTTSPATGVATAVLSGNTVTITAVAAGETTAVVTGGMDGIPTQITYTIKVATKTKDVVQVGDGYVTYEGATTNWVNGELVLTYVNPSVVGDFEIPAPFTAKVDVLAVGGGGAGGTAASGRGQGGGGGGAGGFTYKENLSLKVGNYNVRVGAGGQVVRADDTDQLALTGMKGGSSVITNAFGYVFASASGGGGGGASVASGANGTDGGSGGGSAWYNRKASAAGAGVDGQGFAGGKPTQYSNGGAGGGASGAGGNWNEPGVGKASDITGETVTYAAGGAGGQGSATTAAQSGAGLGNGGAGGHGGLGANGGLGGAGGDGIVVVRIKEVSKSVKVPLPTTQDILRDRYEWSNGTTYKGLVYEGETFTAADGRVYNWNDAISYVSGATNVTCTLDGETKQGIGYYNFTIYLKDGYVWNTEPDNVDSYGSTDGQSHRWSIVEDLENVDAEISVKKSVVNQEGSNATVRVESFTSPEISGKRELNVLFMGTTCTYHYGDLDDDKVIIKSLTAAAESANVHYILTTGSHPQVGHGGSGDSASPVEAKGWNKVGDIPRGQTQGVVEAMVGSIPYGAYEHSALREFYTNLYNVATSPALSNKYDYIILEFDGSRIASNYTEVDGAVVKKVAEFLRPYYESKSVILVVDLPKDGEQWGGGNYWLPNSYYESGGGQNLPKEAFQDLLGMFAPAHYLSEIGLGHTGYQMATVTKSTSGWFGTTYYAYGQRYELQKDYEHVDELEELIRATIKPKPYNLDFVDKIVDPGEGLTIQGVTIQVCTNGVNGVASTDAADWVDFMRWQPSAPATFEYLDTQRKSGINGGWMTVDMANNLVSACFSNIDFQVWSRIDIDVVDDGRFRTNEGATYNDITGQWEKNPNDGPAHVEMTDITEGGAIGVQGHANTSIPMRFRAYKVTGTADNGHVFVNGGGSSALEISEGATVPVYYRGKGGYTIASVTIDGTKYGKGAAPGNENIDSVMTNMHTFAAIARDHEVHVVYEQYAGTVTSAPVTNAYDGVAHLIDVQLGDDWRSPYETEIRYTLDPNAKKSEYMPEADFLEYCRTNNLAKTVAGSGEEGYEIFFEVFAKQPGYGENFEEGWAWIETDIGGSNFSVITPQTLVVKPNRARVISFGDPFPSDTGYSVTGFIEGEDMEVLNTDGWKVVSSEYIQNVSGEGQYATHMEGVDATDVNDSNYIIVTQPGLLDVVKTAMEIGGVPQGPHLNPEDPDVDTGVDRVVRIYDGMAANITVDVTMPEGDDICDIYYSVAGSDGKPTTWVPMTTPSTMVDVGTNKVWYAVEPKGVETEHYFSVTNYSYVIILPRKVTVRADSGSKPYDGTPLVVPTAAAVSGQGDGLAVGDSIAAADITGQQLAVGESVNTLNGVTIRNGAERDVTANYTITLLNGSLEVTPAPIEIGGVPHSIDPTMPNDYGETGVEDVEIFYNGEDTNIVVTVTNPDPSSCSITYSTNGVDWVESIAFTNAGVYQVKFRVEPPAGTGYVPVENYAYVTIKPLEVTVAAEDKEGVVGKPVPPYTAIVTGLLESEKDRVNELISYSLTCPTFEDAVGTYPIIAGGEENQGNYHVTYIPGTLTMVERQRVVSLWIVDHADAGAGRVHLAFKPTLNAGTLSAEFLKELETAGAIKVKCAATEKALESAPLKPIFSLRDGTGTQHLDRGWIWITVNVPDDATDNGPERLWKIVVQLPD